MDNLFTLLIDFCLPIIAVTGLFYFIEARRKESPDAKTGKMHLVLLLLLPLAISTAYLYFQVLIWAAEHHRSLSWLSSEGLPMLCASGVVLAAVLIEQIAVRLLRLTKKQRLNSMFIMMTVTPAAEVFIFLYKLLKS